MQAGIRRRLSRAARALDFVTAHPVADAGFATVVKRLDSTVTRADALVMQQSDGRISESAAVGRRHTLQQEIRDHYLRRLVTIAVRATKTNPELAGKFLMPSRKLPNKPFLLATRSLLTAAAPNKDLFSSLGLGDSFFDDLTKAVDALDASTENAHGGRSGHVGATADLEAMAKETGEDVIVLDTFIRAAYRGNEEILAGWKSARNIAGPFKHQAAPEQPTSDPAVPTPPAKSVAVTVT